MEILARLADTELILNPGKTNGGSCCWGFSARPNTEPFVPSPRFGGPRGWSINLVFLSPRRQIAFYDNEGVRSVFLAIRSSEAVRRRSCTLRKAPAPQHLRCPWASATLSCTFPKVIFATSPARVMLLASIPLPMGSGRARGLRASVQPQANLVPAAKERLWGVKLMHG